MTLAWEYNKADWPRTSLFLFFVFASPFHFLPQNRYAKSSRLIHHASCLRHPCHGPCFLFLWPFPPLPFPLARVLGPLYTCIWTLCGALPCTRAITKRNHLLCCGIDSDPRGLTPLQDQLEAPCPVADDPFQQTSNNRILGQSQGRSVCGKASVPPAEFLTFGPLGLDFVANTFGRLFLNSIAWYFPAPHPLCLGVP